MERHQFLFYLSLSGALGVLVRYFMSLKLDNLFSHIWFGTAIVNSLGSFLAGVIFALATQKQAISQDFASILLIGFCGGFTTYSAYSFQNFQLIQQGLFGQALLNIGVIPLAGVLYTFIGYYSVRWFV